MKNRRPSDFVPAGLQAHCPFVSRQQLFKAVIPFAQLPGDFAEFGTHKGVTAREILEDIPENKLLWLFDSWLGLPTAWDLGDHVEPKGKFSSNGMRPNLEHPAIRFIDGWFEDTVDVWARMLIETKDHRGPLAFIHMDADLYASTKTVFDALTKHKLIVPGTVIQFDELIGYPTYQLGEYRALREADFKWQWLGRSSTYHVAIVVTG